MEAIIPPATTPVSIAEFLVPADVFPRVVSGKIIIYTVFGIILYTSQHNRCFHTVGQPLIVSGVFQCNGRWLMLFLFFKTTVDRQSKIDNRPIIFISVVIKSNGESCFHEIL